MLKDFYATLLGQSEDELEGTMDTVSDTININAFGNYLLSLDIIA